jgi:hypothetical protein
LTRRLLGVQGGASGALPLRAGLLPLLLLLLLLLLASLLPALLLMALLPPPPPLLVNCAAAAVAAEWHLETAAWQQQNCAESLLQAADAPQTALNEMICGAAEP